MNLENFMSWQKKPSLFSPGEPLFWDDPHISAQMLQAHLDPSHDHASRRPEIIQQSVDWLIATLHLQAGCPVLDLGCGPGLYAARLAEQGLCVTGVDYSRRSVAYARQSAQQRQLDIQYRFQDYLTLDDESQFDVVLLIYGDFCPLSPEQRGKLLRNIHRALKPDGYFVLDVTTPTHRQEHGNRNGWYVCETGFWRPGPHLVLEQGFDYPESAVFLDQAVVVEGNGRIAIFRNWFQDYTRETITAELERGGFAVCSVWKDLRGTPFTPETGWIGLITQKESQQGRQ